MFVSAAAHPLCVRRTLARGSVRPVYLQSDSVVHLFLSGILQILSIVAVISNGAVIAFTSQFVDRAVYEYDHTKFDMFLTPQLRCTDMLCREAWMATSPSRTRSLSTTR